MVDIWSERGRVGSTQLDSHGLAIKFDIREDEEHATKLNETVELLVAAGYFRARIKGLSAFDKVVGGLTWCISTCNIDIDVDLLYQENAHIGQKIALTEKIVNVLHRLKCPHSIEPHQIQGLDMIHIFPLVQWLVKKAIETREEMGDSIRAYALWRFDSKFLLKQNVKDQKKPKHLATLANSPLRKYRRKATDDLQDETERVASTLFEYSGSRASTSSAMEGKADGTSGESGYSQIESGSSGFEEVMAFDAQEKSAWTETASSLIRSSNIRAAVSEVDDGSLDGFRVEHPTYLASRQNQLELDIADIKDKIEVMKAQEQEVMTNLAVEQQKCETVKAQYDQVAQEIDTITEIEAQVEQEKLDTLKTLTAKHDEVKAAEQEFKRKCKEDILNLENEIINCQERLTRSGTVEESEEHTAEVRRIHQETSQSLQAARLKMAKKNREIAVIQRQIDEIPSQAELNQYQRRFLELYNQMSTKHKETKQYFTMYNSLLDIKSYMEKEVNFLNSIYDSYEQAMGSELGKREFVTQIDQILEGIKTNQRKVERRVQEVILTKDALQQKYMDILEKQRQYYKTVKEFQEECRRNETMLAQLKKMGIEY